MRPLKWMCLIALLASVAHPASAARPVVIEEFTATWCPSCYGAGRGLDRVEANYDRSKVIVLAYHLNDDYTDYFCDLRSSYYNVASIPNIWFNGLAPNLNYGYSVSQGEAGVNAMYNTLASRISQEQQRIANSTPFTIVVTGTPGPNKPKMTIYITSNGYPRAVTLYAYITEDGIPCYATNGQTSLSGVVRAYIGTATFTMAAKGTKILNGSLTYEIPYYNANKLYPAVIIQDTETNEIVGAVGEFTKNAIDCDWSLYE